MPTPEKSSTIASPKNQFDTQEVKDAVHNFWGIVGTEHPTMKMLTNGLREIAVAAGSTEVAITQKHKNEKAVTGLVFLRSVTQEAIDSKKMSTPRRQPERDGLKRLDAAYAEKIAKLTEDLQSRRPR